MNKLTPKQISKYSKIIIKTHNGIHEKKYHNLPLKSDMIKYILSGHDDSYSVKRFEYFDEEDLIAKCMMTYLMDERMSIFFDYIKQNYKEDNRHKRVVLAFIALTSQMSLFTNCTCTTKTLNYYYEYNFKNKN
jgi:hypothetical protein